MIELLALPRELVREVIVSVVTLLLVINKAGIATAARLPLHGHGRGRGRVLCSRGQSLRFSPYSTVR